MCLGMAMGLGRARVVRAARRRAPALRASMRLRRRRHRLWVRPRSRSRAQPPPLRGLPAVSPSDLTRPALDRHQVLPPFTPNPKTTTRRIGEPRAKPVAKPAKMGQTRAPSRASERRSSARVSGRLPGDGVEFGRPACRDPPEATKSTSTLGSAGAPWAGDLPANLTLDPTRPVVRASGLPPNTLLVEPLTGESSRDFGWLKTLTLPELPVRWDARVVRYLDYYRSDVRGKNLVQSWVRKSGRYGAAMRRALHEQGLPDDLIWVSLVESGFDPAIRSPGAAGLWQLMPGRAHGLVVDRWIDERLEPSGPPRRPHVTSRICTVASAPARARAYNMGYGALLSATQVQHQRLLSSQQSWSGIPTDCALTSQDHRAWLRPRTTARSDSTPSR